MKTALGKGLSALIPEKEKSTAEAKSGDVLDLDMEHITPNEYQPRKIFDEDALNDLVRSIKEKGVIQPVIVRQVADSMYQLIAGERRWRASQKAGLSHIPAIVKETAPAEALELALIENIQREDLNPIETAEAFQRLIGDFKLTQDDLSKKVGKDRTTVSNYLRILKLPSDIKRWIAEGVLSTGHAKALLQVSSERLQSEIARKVIKNGLNVRETEALCSKDASKRSAPKSLKTKDPQIVALEEKLIHSLGTKVRLIHKSSKKGKIEIEYYSLEELDRLLEVLIQ